MMASVPTTIEGSRGNVTSKEDNPSNHEITQSNLSEHATESNTPDYIALIQGLQISNPAISSILESITFHPFPKLPGEIRNGIWKLALPDARTVSCVAIDDNYDKTLLLKSPITVDIPAIALLQTCREARSEALRLYKRMHLDNAGLAIYFDPEIDVAVWNFSCIDPHCSGMCFDLQLTQFNPVILTNLRFLTLDIAVSDPAPSFYHSGELVKLPSLELLRIFFYPGFVMDDVKTGKEQQELKFKIAPIQFSLTSRIEQATDGLLVKNKAISACIDAYAGTLCSNRDFDVLVLAVGESLTKIQDMVDAIKDESPEWKVPVIDMYALVR